MGRPSEGWRLAGLAYSVGPDRGYRGGGSHSARAHAMHPKVAMIAFLLACYAKRHRQDRGGERARWYTEERRVFALIVITASSFLLPAPRESRKLELTDDCMTEKEYEALYEALEAAHKILPGAKECDAKDAELRKKMRKLEKAVRKRQEKVARAEGRKNK